MPALPHPRRGGAPLQPLTTRERRVALAGLAATLVAALAIVVIGSAGDRHPPPPAGCIRALVAGRVGGEVIHACGARARAICARTATFEGPRAAKILASCREQGVGPAAPRRRASGDHSDASSAGSSASTSPSSFTAASSS